MLRLRARMCAREGVIEQAVVSIQACVTFDFLHTQGIMNSVGVIEIFFVNHRCIPASSLYTPIVLPPCASHSILHPAAQTPNLARHPTHAPHTLSPASLFHPTHPLQKNQKSTHVQQILQGLFLGPLPCYIPAEYFRRIKRER